MNHFPKFQLEFINFSHPDFIGGKKAVELAMQEVKTLQVKTFLIGRKKIVIVFI